MTFNVQFSCSVTYTWWFVHSGWLLMAEVKAGLIQLAEEPTPTTLPKPFASWDLLRCQRYVSCYFQNQVLHQIDTSIDADRFFSHSGLLTRCSFYSTSRKKWDTNALYIPFIHRFCLPLTINDILDNNSTLFSAGRAKFEEEEERYWMAWAQTLFVQTPVRQ